MRDLKKVSGDVGNSGFNTSLGRRNPTPAPQNTRHLTRKNHGVRSLSSRFPYDSHKGEIRDHKN
jgi:hypothetical protein